MNSNTQNSRIGLHTNKSINIRVRPLSSRKLRRPINNLIFLEISLDAVNSPSLEGRILVELDERHGCKRKSVVTIRKHPFMRSLYVVRKMYAKWGRGFCPSEYLNFQNLWRDFFGTCYWRRAALRQSSAAGLFLSKIVRCVPHEEGVSVWIPSQSNIVEIRTLLLQTHFFRTYAYINALKTIVNEPCI
jgi:hypothetical protein